MAKALQPTFILCLWLALLTPQRAAALIIPECDFETVMPKAELLDCAQRYHKLNQAGIAWEILEPQEIVYAGQADYDYMLGLSAIDSNRPGEGVLALERAVNLKPDFSGARYELARAYYYLGDYELARSHFQHVLNDKPPVALKNRIESFMETVDYRLWDDSSFLSGRFSIGGGYDGNATNGPELDTIFVPGAGPGLGGNFDLSENTKANPSGFGKAALALQYNKPLTPDATLSAGVSLRAHDPYELDDLEQLQYGVNTRLSFKGDRHLTQLSLESKRNDVDGKLNNRSHAINLNSTIGLSKRTVTHFAARGAQLRYKSQLEQQDVNQLVVALGFGIRPRSFKADLIAIFGDYHALHNERYNRTLKGGSFKLGAMRLGSAVFSLNYTYLRSDYDGLHQGLKRRDIQNSVVAAVELENMPAQDWSIRNWWRYIDNESTVALYDYSGLQVGLELIRKFK